MTDLEASTRFFDEHVAPGKCPEWVALHREGCIREHVRWCRFERETREAKAARATAQIAMSCAGICGRGERKEAA